ncbi:MAG: SH3 domain-containing protein [Burkholderiaceae bacterium]|nr:SH3 domain-containing protein [Burkholderiaceae bacterium]
MHARRQSASRHAGERRRRRAPFFAAVAAIALAQGAPAALAAEFREVTSAAGVLYDGPSEHARKLYLVPRGTPLERVSSVAGWVKVRDLSGDILWIERGDLGAARHVIASTLAAVRRAPQRNAELLVQVERGVLLEVVDDESPAGWVHVRYPGGAAGYVESVEVWGR